jgi:hypothetical protein
VNVPLAPLSGKVTGEKVKAIVISSPFRSVQQFPKARNETGDETRLYRFISELVKTSKQRLKACSCILKPDGAELRLYKYNFFVSLQTTSSLSRAANFNQVQLSSFIFIFNGSFSLNETRN